MKIVIIGASGAVGRTAVQALSGRHDVVTVGKTSGDIQADIEDISSIQALCQRVGKIDAMVCAVGHGHFGPVKDMTTKDFLKGINGKVMSQVNLVLAGFDYMNDGGSFTLTSGVLNRDPIRGGAAAAAANGAIDGFVKGAAVDMPRGIRINAVSPEVLETSRQKYDGFFRGHTHVSDEAVGLAYSKSVEGCLTGQVFIVE
ncbi:short chain dehydrogenase [Sulfitobacter sp. JL08]|uniref:short chain dehydrogenase n=1 Tax=Sulfitobacter sp. JL08 TaxID=2070369 RepID=UPI000E0C844B|nr:short chain dehydrogenase [Sulfitobacter sp. JL08]AXI56062.1 short chain dehydrogenase [Sulfitobacter sp. JL08]